MNLPQDQPQPVVATEVIKTKKELVMFFLSGFGTILAGLGTLPVESSQLPLPPEWRPYIISVGFFAVTLERWLKVIQGMLARWHASGINFVILLLSVCCFGLTSCGITFTEDGCILGNYTKGGSSYAAGPCVGTDSQVDRFRVQWSNDQDQKLRATYWTKAKKPVLVEYLTGGVWIKWDSKSGVMIGPVPPEVESALEGKPEPIEAPKLTEILP